MRKILTLVATIAVLGMLATASLAAVTFDAEAGTGFVGKGDVQLALGLNNSQIQTATLAFAYEGNSEQVTTWDCNKDGAIQSQERTRTTTTEVSGVVSSVARLKNQITGYNLTGFSSSSSSSSTDGAKLGSCPNNWTATTPVVGPVVDLGGGLTVNGVALQ